MTLAVSETVCYGVLGLRITPLRTTRFWYYCFAKKFNLVECADFFMDYKYIESCGGFKYNDSYNYISGIFIVIYALF